MVKVEEIAEKYKDYEVDEEELKEILVQPKPKTVWDLKEGYRYWWIDTKGIVHSALWMDCNGVDKEVHILRRAFGNCFLTKEEAEFEVMKRKVETSLLKYGRREFKPHQDNLCLGYDHDNEEIVECNYICTNKGVIYFDTKELYQQAINAAGEDNIKKYIFGVKD